MKLTNENVATVFAACLSRGGDAVNREKLVTGVMRSLKFDTNRLEAHRTDINDMLDELPKQFHAGDGGGWSFLNACMTKDGDQWTGLHDNMEKLFMLGMGIDRVSEILSSMRDAMPGGMPYYVVTKREDA